MDSLCNVILLFLLCYYSYDVCVINIITSRKNEATLDSDQQLCSSQRELYYHQVLYYENIIQNLPYQTITSENIDYDNSNSKEFRVIVIGNPGIFLIEI